MTASAPLLVIEHQTSCPPGWLGQWLRSAGLTLDIRRPYAAGRPAGSLPAHLDDHAGMLVLGGSMSANDDDTVAWLPGVKDLLRLAAVQSVPTLGVCLGHQLAAVALGGRVEPNPRGQTTGVQPVRWTSAVADDPVLGPIAAVHGDGTVAVQWNDDIVVTPPAGTVELARATTGELTAARFAPTVWGVQWHPEAGADLVAPWADQDRVGATARGVDVQDELDRIRVAEPALRHTWSRLGDSFAAAIAGTGARRSA